MKSNLFYSNIENKIVVNLQNTKVNVKIAVAWFTNPTLFHIIENLNNKNIEIELVLSNEKLNFTNEKINFQKLIDKNVLIKVSEHPNLMHNKFCIIDNRILITGSYNWTLKAEKSNYENIIISTDEKLVDDFLNYFDFLKENLETVSSVSKIKLNQYIDKKEMELEIELIHNKENKSIEIKSNEVEIIYTEDLCKEIDKAELLYLNEDLKEAIDFSEKQLKKYKEIPEFYEILALCYWRLKDFEKQILYSHKVIELESNIEVSISAYNLLGIGYSLKKGGEQQSVFYYKKCIDQKPNEHSFYRNRAISYINLTELSGLPLRIRKNYKQKADKDLKKIIEIAKKIDNKDYQILHSEALAYALLGNLKLALSLINKSIESFVSETDIFKKDKNEFREIKRLQKELQKAVN